jgi:creatinine amidohydrolase
MNWQEIKDIVPKKINSVILPIGTMEAHGTSGLGTDSILAEKISERMASELNCLVAPTINYGITNTLLPYPGSMTVSKEAFELYVMDVLYGLERIGFDRIVVMNGHGGQEDELKAMVTNFNKDTDVKIVLFQWWYFGDQIRKKIYNSDIESGHSSLEETAMMIGLCPEGVREDLYKDSLRANYHRGYKAIPAPGTILTFPGEMPPDFDKIKAKNYSDAIINELINVTKNIFKQWDVLL